MLDTYPFPACRNDFFLKKGDSHESLPIHDPFPASHSLYDYGSRVNFSSQVLPMLAPELTEEDESLFQLMLYSDTLIASTKSSFGIWRLKIAEWDGTGYSRVAITPPQSEQLVFNRVHSGSTSVEFFYSNYMEGCISRSDDGAWHLTAMNGEELILFNQDSVEDVSMGYDFQNNDVFHYGYLPFSTDLDRLDLPSIPPTLSQILPLLDRSLCVCTARDNTSVYAEPDGPLLAACYARVPGTLIKQEGEWVQFGIGSVQEGWTV